MIPWWGVGFRNGRVCFGILGMRTDAQGIVGLAGHTPENNMMLDSHPGFTIKEITL